MCFSITSLQFSLTKWELQFTLLSKKRQRSSHNTGASTLRRTRSPTIHLFQFFFFLSLIFHFVLRHFFWGGVEFWFLFTFLLFEGECWISNRNHSVLINRWRWPSEPLFRKDPQRPVSLSFYWIATLSRPSCLVVLSLFKKFFLQFTSCSFCLSSTRNRYSLFHLYVKLYFVFLFMFVGCFSPQYIYPQKRTHVYPWNLTAWEFVR